MKLKHARHLATGTWVSVEMRTIMVKTLDITGHRIERFFHDMVMSLSEMKRVLRKKKYCCITIGNPGIRRQTLESE